MAATVVQAELDRIKIKEADDPQVIDDKFNELAMLYTASGSALTATIKKTQLLKIIPSLYSGCINTVSQTAQSVITTNAFNNLIARINAGSTTSAGFTSTPVDIEAIKCTYEQVHHAMQVRFNNFVFHNQPNSIRMV